MAQDRDGLLFRYEGKMIGMEMLPKEILGSSSKDGSRFWISYLRVGELFFYKGGWYKVEINKLEKRGGQEAYTFYASTEKLIVREE